jgi:uncharacterized membrane protein YbhN (UPF0104 family)
MKVGKSNNRQGLRRVLGALAVLAIAVCLIIFAVAQGDASDTLHKAIRICFECIGIA